MRISDWSSDVCSSDLMIRQPAGSDDARRHEQDRAKLHTKKSLARIAERGGAIAKRKRGREVEDREAGDNGEGARQRFKEMVAEHTDNRHAISEEHRVGKEGVRVCR